VPETQLHPYALQKSISDLSGCRVMLQLTDNVSTMLSMKTDPGDVRIVRAHRMFLKAGSDVQQNIANWIAGRGLDHDALNRFISENEPAYDQRKSPRSTRVVHTDSDIHDLVKIRDSLNNSYFENRSTAAITWGRKPNKSTRSVRLGCYDPVDNRITISRRLDRRDIPHYMVEYVVFHEMLHEIIGIGKRADGKRDIHGKTFRLLESQFPHYKRAKEFERKKWGGSE